MTLLLDEKTMFSLATRTNHCDTPASRVRSSQTHNPPCKYAPHTGLWAHGTHDRLALSNIEIVTIELSDTGDTQSVALLLSNDRWLDLHAQIRVWRNILVAAVALLDDDGALDLELLKGSVGVLDTIRALVLKVLPVAVRVLDTRHHVVVVVHTEILKSEKLNHPSSSSTMMMMVVVVEVVEVEMRVVCICRRLEIA
jgi:hypothetical protein